MLSLLSDRVLSVIFAVRVMVSNFFAVHCFIVLEHLPSSELIAALPAGQRRLLSVGLEMLFLVCHLVERLVTAIHWA